MLPDFRYNEARSFIAGGLQDFSISRAGQPWGIPLPWDESQVAYVWADALVNYLSALTYARPGEDLVPVYWPVARHMLGKGILRFHCVFWPAMLLSAGYDVPHQLFAHGYLLMGEQKISKSLGNVIDPLPLVDVYGIDAVRYWAIRAATLRPRRCGLGGKPSRALRAGAGERAREPRLADDGDDRAIPRRRAAVRGPAVAGDSRASSTPCTARSRRGSTPGSSPARWSAIWDVVRELNRLVERAKPWELAKDEDKAGELDAVLYDLADGVRSVAIALYAYLPATSAGDPACARPGRGRRLGRRATRWARAGGGIEPAPPLFPRVERAAGV